VTRFIRSGKAHSAASLFGAITLFGAALASFLLVGISRASAAKSDCPDASYCVWDGYTYSGTMWRYYNGNPTTNTWFGLPDPPGDRISSAYNTRANKVLIGECSSGPSGVCSDPPPANAKDCMIPNGSRGDLGGFLWPNGDVEDNTLGFIDLIYSGTTC
jgi:hypothetical protein